MTWHINIFFLATVMLLVLRKVSLQYVPDSVGVCRNNNTEYFKKDQKLCCSKCLPGTHLDTPCTVSSDTQCKPCGSGYYSDKFNYFPKCFRCHRCREDDGLQTTHPCTSSSQTVCECRKGMFCKLHRLSVCKECMPLTSCPPGQGVSEPGTADTDVKCSACAEGTFSDQHSSNRTCQNHTDCYSQGRSVLRHGNSTSDTLCGSIDRTTMPPTSNPNVLSGPHTGAPPLPYPSTTPPPDGKGFILGLGGMLLLLMLLVTVIVLSIWRKRGTNENIEEVDGGVNRTPEDQQQSSSNPLDRQCMLGSEDLRDPALSLASSYIEGNNSSSQERLLKESQQVNVNITFNCHLNQGAPPCPILEPVPPEPDLPLSAEEAHHSEPQQEEGKESCVAEQESDCS